MTIGARIAWDDTVLPFQLDRSDVRGRVVRLDEALDRMLAQHDYPAPIEALLAEAALITALIGQTLKLRWKLSLQIRGDGPARLIATDFFAAAEPGQPAWVRAYAGFDVDRIDARARPFDLMGQGYFALTIDQGTGTSPYQGITPIDGGSIAACAETYFAQSEQLPTRFALSFDRTGPAERWRGGGVMLQHMPAASSIAGDGAGGAGGSGADGVLRRGDILGGDAREDWDRANKLLDTVEAAELIGPGVQPTDLLVRLFHEETPRVFEAQPVTFGCTCSADKVRRSLEVYAADDIAEMTTEAGVVTADCQFCGAHYELDPATLGSEAGAPPPDDAGS